VSSALLPPIFVAMSILGAIQKYGHGERPVNRQCAGRLRKRDA
jgi:hypothetical protein